VVCYMDATIGFPILVHYALAKHKKRRLKKLYFKRNEMVRRLIHEYFAHHK